MIDGFGIEALGGINSHETFRYSPRLATQYQSLNVSAGKYPCRGFPKIGNQGPESGHDLFCVPGYLGFVYKGAF
jgi:hypothetical protein